MKTYIITIVLLFFSCSSSKENQLNKLDCNFYNKITESEKKINIDSYIKELNLNGYYTLFENDSIEITVDANNENWRKYKINKIYNIEEDLLYNKQTLKLVNSYSFYNKGNFNIGNEYFYNEKGEIIKTIDHNQYDKYPICYKEIINSTIKKADKNFYFQGLEKDSIKSNNENRYFWKVYFQDTITIAPTLRHQFFRIDAKTNKTLEEKTF